MGELRRTRSTVHNTVYCGSGTGSKCIHKLVGKESNSKSSIVYSAVCGIYEWVTAAAPPAVHVCLLSSGRSSCTKAN